MSIKVSLDINANPPVTVSPTVENVNNGNQTVKWVPAQNQPNFTFVGVTFWTTPNPFSAPTITTNPVEMTVTEDNNSSGTSYKYTIAVTYSGTTYYSAQQSPKANGGTPTIHNN